MHRCMCERRPCVYTPCINSPFEVDTDSDIISEGVLKRFSEKVIGKSSVCETELFFFLMMQILFFILFGLQ